MKMTDAPDYYQVLQVHPSAEPEVIQAAYRRLSLKYHPDVNKSKASEVRMRELNAAYEVLSDPQKRAAYNRAKTRPRTAQGISPVLHVAPTEVDLGMVVVEGAKTAVIHLSNGGGGTLNGFLVSHVPWLKVSPPDFEGNDLDIILRFQASKPGLYQRLSAVEIYSNGGRSEVSIRAIVTPFRKGVGTTSVRREAVSLAHPGTDNTKAARRGPSAFWLVFMAALMSGFVWYLVNPWLVVLPLPIGMWLAWHKISGEGVLPMPFQGLPGGRKPLAAHCLGCGFAISPARSTRCPRCGGNVCPSCGACGCSSGKARLKRP